MRRLRVRGVESQVLGLRKVGEGAEGVVGGGGELRVRRAEGERVPRW